MPRHNHPDDQDTPGYNGCYQAYPMSDEIVQTLDALRAFHGMTDPQDREHAVYRWRVQRYHRDVVMAAALDLTRFIEERHPVLTKHDRKLLEEIAARLQRPFMHANHEDRT